MTAAPPATLPGLLARLAAQGGEQPFLHAAGRTLTATEFAAQARALAHALAALGVRAGDRVAVYLEKRPEKALAPFAIGLCGAVSVILNPRLRDAQVRHVLDDSGATVVLTSAEKCVLLADPAAAFGAARVARVEELPRAGAPPPALPPSPGDPATILYTSGSTGLPKGIVQTHQNLVEGAEIVAGYLGLRAEDHVLAVLPLSFDYGLNQLLAAAWTGCEITLLQYLAPAELFDALERQRATGLAGVPSLWHAFAETLRREPARAAQCAALRYVTNSGGRFALADIRTLRETLPHVKVFSMYGLTEAFRSAFLDPRLIDRHPDAIGTAIPRVELLVIDPDTGRECASGEVGELVHAGALVAAGYWNRPEDTARVFRPHPLDPARGRAVWSGDFVTRGADGLLRFVGRRDRQLKVAGMRVSPDEVETAVRAVPGVREAAVVGRPDPAGGDQVVAFVTGEITGDAVVAALRRTQPSWLVPARVEVLAALPLNPNGTVDLGELIRRLGA